MNMVHISPWGATLGLLARGAQLLAPGAPLHALDPALDVREGDLRLRKYRFSAFTRNPEDPEALLRARGIDTVVVAGVAVIAFVAMSSDGTPIVDPVEPAAVRLAQGEVVIDPLTGQVKTAQLGSASRLDTIFRTNLQSAYSVGRWQAIEALAEDGIKSLDDFATCADWELAGGWTTEGGERKKDEGVLEKFDVSLEEAQNLVMTARVMLGWVDPTELASAEAEEIDEEEAEA